MKPEKSNKSTKFIVFATVTLFAVIGVIAFAYSSATSKGKVQPAIRSYNSNNGITAAASVPKTGETKAPARLGRSDTMNKAVLSVEGMSCSGCIFTIKSALSDVKGIRDVLVDVSAGRAEVYYDQTEMQDVNRIPEVISASGYPAKIIQTMSSDQMQQESERAAAKARTYIASVGEFDIARTDFDIALNHAKNRYAKIYGDAVFDSERGKALLDSLKVQIVSTLVNEGIQLQEIQKAGYKMAPGMVDSGFQEFLGKRKISRDQLKSELIQNGYDFNYFIKKFETRLLINNYIEATVLDGVANDFEKQQRYGSWFNNARLLAKVEYYDKNIEKLIQSQAAGGGCSGGGCSSAR